MPSDNWELVQLIGPADLALSLPWHFLYEIDDAYALLCLKAEGEWDCLGTALKPCGPDGHAGLFLTDRRLLVESSPAGALVGKFGGSTAGPDPSSSAFAIGSRCYVAMPERRPVALFVAINGALTEARPELINFKFEIFGANSS
jgi:hypothetical protein